MEPTLLPAYDLDGNAEDEEQLIHEWRTEQLRRSACPASSRRPSPISSTGTRSQTSSTAAARRGLHSTSSAEAVG
jgi:hypothetical protein